MNFGGFPTDFSASHTVGRAPITNVTDGSFYWAPLNLADYEDMSWNLNRLKIARKKVDANPGFAEDASIEGRSFHRLNSEIMQNNVLNAYAGFAESGPRDYYDAPFKFNMVFRQGTLDYTLMNKGDGPIKVELIVYRVKKRGNASVPAPFADFSMDHIFYDPVRDGYYDKVAARGGTDFLNGRVPNSYDCIQNPQHPFLPMTKYTNQNLIPFAEVQRVPIIIPAGSRRPVKIFLGGDKYDPSNFTGRVNGSDSTSRAVLDSHAYLVAISVHGVQTTRQVKAGDVKYATTAYTSNTINVGDMYGPADLQWYMDYTEEIEAAAYKDPGSSKIFVNGALENMAEALAGFNDTLVPNGSGGWRAKTAEEKLYTTPVTMIPQDRAVRIPVTQDRYEYGTQGAGASTASYSTSTPGAAATSGPTVAPTDS